MSKARGMHIMDVGGRILDRAKHGLEVWNGFIVLGITGYCFI